MENANKTVTTKHVMRLQPTDQNDGIESISLGITTKLLSTTLSTDTDDKPSSITTANGQLHQPSYDEAHQIHRHNDVSPLSVRHDADRNCVVISSDGDDQSQSSGDVNVKNEPCPKEVACANDHTLRGIDHPTTCQRDQLQSQLDQGLIDANQRLGDLWQVLRTQVSRTWSQFNNSASNDEFNDRMKLHCWLTPVRWVRQTGPNCGLAVLAMAARPLCTGDVAADSDANGGEDIGNRMEGADEHVPTLADLQSRAINAGYSGRGEMFSATDLAKLAGTHQYGRYRVRLVKRDLLLQGKARDVNSIRHDDIDDIKWVRDDCRCPRDIPVVFKDQARNLFDELDSDSCLAPRQVVANNRPEHDPSYALSLVQRLIRGQLIAVCFDCDKNMMPCSTNGGRTAHWALLCGVIVQKSKLKSTIQARDDFQTAEVFSKMVTDDSNNISMWFNEPTLESGYDGSDLDLERDADRVWVVARHGKQGRYVVWSLKELADSNRQLRTPAERILRTIPAEVRKGWKYDPLVDSRELPLSCDEDKIMIEVDYAKEQYFDRVHLPAPLEVGWQSSELPPAVGLPPQAPPLPPPVLAPAMHNDINLDAPPFILTEGPLLEHSLSRQYVVFEPVRPPHLITSHLVRAEEIPSAMNPLLCYFVFDGERS